MQKRTKLDINTHAPLLNKGQQLYAHITGPKEGTAGKYLITWEQHEGGRCVARANRPHTYTYDPKKETWDTAIRNMQHKAIKAYHFEQTPKNVPLDTPTPRVGYLNSFDAHMSQLKKYNWSKSTWDLYRPAIRNLCRKLDTLDVIDITSVAKLIQEQIEETAQNKLSKGPKAAAKTVEHNMVAADYCLTLLCTICNEQAGYVCLQPVPIWDALGRTKSFQLETAKWIAEDILVKLAECLFRFVCNGLSMGVALMLCMGLRTSEACAVRMGELELRKGYVVYKVQTQGPDRNPILKTENAYRITVGGRLLYDLIKSRRKYLRKMGYSNEEIDLMPAVSLEETPDQHIDIRHLSQYARQLLFACGYDPDDYNTAAKMMAIQPDYEADGTPMQSVSAYIFRRCFATMICNYCSIMPDNPIEDYLLGHKLKRKLTIDPTNPEVQEKIARRMDRWVIHSQHTSHPYFDPVVLSKDMDVIDLGEHSAYTFVADVDMEIVLHVQTAEPNGILDIATTGKIRKSTLRQHPGTTDTDVAGGTRPIILLPESKEWYAGLIKEAQQIVLDKEETE